MLTILTTIDSLKAYVSTQQIAAKSLGLVPTMGALHAGHLALIAQSKAENDLTICSIFVNPTQFNSAEDLQNYPRPSQQDEDLLEEAGCDVLFRPSTVSEVYPLGEVKFQLDLGDLEHLLEGRSRPGHYQGVSNIVHKLLVWCQPDRAYFGQKDYQQLLVIRKMVAIFALPVQIICHPTLRHPDGLAMSSRNIHLNVRQRAVATGIYKALQQARTSYLQGSSVLAITKLGYEMLRKQPLFEVDYFQVCLASSLKPIEEDPQKNANLIALAAVKIGTIRLIDNLLF